jgi:hypothetical protein
MHSGTTETLHCADCGRSDGSVVRHSGAVSARGDEGRVRHTNVALCPSCAAERLEIQEAALI